MNRPLPGTVVRTSEEARKHALLLESARRRIPVNTYLAALHHAVCTGHFPDIEPNTGKIDTTPADSNLTTEQRVEVTQFMLSLALPQLKRVAPIEVDETAEVVRETLVTRPGDIRALTTDQLKDAIDSLARDLADRTPEAGTGQT